jgi:hypothetical protein
MSPSRSQFAIRKWMTLVAACAVILTLVRSPALAGVMTILMLFSPFLVECYKGVQRLRKSSRGSNQNLDFGGYAWQLVNLGILVSLWLGLSGLLVVARGKPEAFLVTTSVGSVAMMPLTTWTTLRSGSGGRIRAWF